MKFPFQLRNESTGTSDMNIQIDVKVHSKNAPSETLSLVTFSHDLPKTPLKRNRRSSSHFDGTLIMPYLLASLSDRVALEQPQILYSFQCDDCVGKSSVSVGDIFTYNLKLRISCPHGDIPMSLSLRPGRHSILSKEVDCMMSEETCWTQIHKEDQALLNLGPVRTVEVYVTYQVEVNRKGTGGVEVTDGHEVVLDLGVLGALSVPLPHESFLLRNSLDFVSPANVISLSSHLSWMAFATLMFAGRFLW